MSTIALSELLGTLVYDSSGITQGRVREVALAPQEDRTKIALFIVKTSSGNRLLPLSAVSASTAGCVRPRRREIGYSPMERKACCF